MNDLSDIKVVPITEYPLWDKAKKNRTLLNVTLELTSRCNNACSHCYINLPENDAQAKKEELTLDEIKQYIDEASSLGALWFLLTGGEPLLREDFFEIYLYLKKKGMLVSLFTNASLISDKHIKLFKKYPPRDIEVTLYGITRKIHQKVTRKNYFSQTMEGIKKLNNASLPVTFKATIMKSNQSELEKIADFCKIRSKKPFRFDPFLSLRIDRDNAKNKIIESERLTPEEIITLEKNDVLRHSALKKKCGNISQDSPINRHPDNIFICGAGLNSCCIGYNGTLKLCSSLSHKDCTYNLRTGTLTDAWKYFILKLRSMTSDKKSYQDKCGKCNLISLCMWCPAHADLETGFLDKPVDYFCKLATKRHDIFS